MQHSFGSACPCSCRQQRPTEVAAGDGQTIFTHRCGVVRLSSRCHELVYLCSLSPLPPIALTE